MTALVAMSPASFAAFVEIAVADYAASSVAAGRWAAADALALSRAEFGALLPQGLQTPDQHLYEIRAAADGPMIGFLWFALVTRGSLSSAYVFQLQIEPAQRRRGHARAAFEAMEALAAGLGATSIGLHVFAGNEAAQALYRSLGYHATGVNMLKPLGPHGRG